MTAGRDRSSGRTCRRSPERRCRARRYRGAAGIARPEERHLPRGVHAIAGEQRGELVIGLDRAGPSRAHGGPPLRGCPQRKRTGALAGSGPPSHPREIARSGRYGFGVCVTLQVLDTCADPMVVAAVYVSVEVELLLLDLTEKL